MVSAIKCLYQYDTKISFFDGDVVFFQVADVARHLQEDVVFFQVADVARHLQEDAEIGLLVFAQQKLFSYGPSSPANLLTEFHGFMRQMYYSSKSLNLSRAFDYCETEMLVQYNYSDSVVVLEMLVHYNYSDSVVVLCWFTIITVTVL